MEKRYKDLYSTGSSRLGGYDYSSDGSYFVTICTKNKFRYLGELKAGKTILSATGIIVEKFWNEIPQHFPQVVLDEYVIMPDHIHGIIIINHKLVGTPILEASKPDVLQKIIPGLEKPECDVPDLDIPKKETPKIPAPILETPKLGVSTVLHAAREGEDVQIARPNSDSPFRGIAGLKPKPSGIKSGSLSAIINQFKRICTITIRNSGYEFEWQSRFYDRIIRSIDELNAIRDYIRNNPDNWDKSP